MPQATKSCHRRDPVCTWVVVMGCVGECVGVCVWGGGAQTTAQMSAMRNMTVSETGLSVWKALTWWLPYPWSQPLWQPPPTACLTASGASSEVPSILIHPCPPTPPAFIPISLGDIFSLPLVVPYPTNPPPPLAGTQTPDGGEAQAGRF